MKALFLTFLILMGCEEMGIIPVKFKVDPALEPYVESFYREAAARGVYPHRNVEVKLGNAGGEYTLGRSRTRGKRHTVTISDDFFYNMSATYSGDTLFHSMEHLVFHELGHAVLERDHCDPCYGIMHSMMSVMEYAGDEPLRKKMIDDLFITE